MKKRFIILLLGFLPSTLFSQTISDFFTSEGVSRLAELAHPTNSFKSGKFTIISSELIEVKIFYYDDYYTKLEVTRYGDFFTDIRIISENDFIPSFLAIELIKDIAMDMVDYDSETASNFENYIGKTISEMNGTELACLILTVAWFNY